MEDGWWIDGWWIDGWWIDGWWMDGWMIVVGRQHALLTS